MHIQKCNVQWDSPSVDSLGSMPLGNGQVGANVWVCPEGYIHLYLSHTDAWDEYSRLVKLGELHFSTSGPVHEWIQNGFELSLDLESGSISIHIGASPQPNLQLRIWIDAHHPVLRVEASCTEPVLWQAELGTWRTELRKIPPGETNASMNQDGEHEVAYEYPDHIIPDSHRGDNQVGLYHRNQRSMLPELLGHQNLTDFADHINDPLANRTFGCLVECSADDVQTGGSREKQTLQTTSPDQNIRFFITLHCDQSSSRQNWLDTIREMAEQASAVDVQSAWEKHTKHWHNFWQRSYIDVTGDAAADKITQVYALQRYITECASHGEFPVKFNGSIFTMEGPPENRPEWDSPQTFSADYRRWGGCYWFQNTRLIYWPLLATGDLDGMRPWFNLYENVLPLCRHRCQELMGKSGVFFPETMSIWGTYRNVDYGFDESEEMNPAMADNRYIRRYWQGGLELSTIMLNYLQHTDDQTWWTEQARDVVMEVLRFYRDYYSKRDAEGKMVMEPSQSLETWGQATNPTPDIAGLHHVIDRLLDLPEQYLTAGNWDFLEAFKDDLPPVPVGSESNGDDQHILPAEEYEDRQNMENCALYAVFPYTLGAIGESLYEEALAAWPDRRMQAVGGWFQDALHAAMLGHTDTAADMLTAALASEHADEDQAQWLKWEQNPDVRFPGFFGPNCDWVPDQDHAAVNMLALQKMCLQTHGGDIRILPAWPERWDVSFKLHAPHGTVVEVEYKDRKIERLEVTPQQRIQDVIEP